MNDKDPLSLLCQYNAADDLVMLGARAAAAKVLT